MQLEPQRVRRLASREGAAREALARRSAPPRAAKADRQISSVTVFEASFRTRSSHDRTPTYATFRHPCSH